MGRLCKNLQDWIDANSLARIVTVIDLVIIAVLIVLITCILVAA